MYSRAIKILQNPIVGILIALTIGYLYFWLSQEKHELSFSISKSEIIVSKKINNPELQIRWMDKPLVGDLRRIKVAIWNSGTTLIDYSNISKSLPIRISFSNNLELISQEVSSKSRESIDVTTNVETNDQSKVVDINFSGDDALEANDGVVLSLFYIGSEKPDIDLQGRIKGLANGFKIVEWSKIQSRSIFEDTGIKISVIYFAYTSLLLFIAAGNFFKENKYIKIFIYNISMYLLGLGYFLFVFIVVVGSIKTIFFGMKWIN